MKKIIIANLTLDPETRTLINHVGQTIILRPLPYNVFTLLLEQKGQSVSRDQLFNKCWEGSVVTDQALTNVISGLRQNLTQLQANGITLKTVSKIGYLLTIDEEASVTSHQEKTNELSSKESNNTQMADPALNHNKKAVMEDALVSVHQHISVQRFIASVLITLCLLIAIGGVYWYGKASSIPHFLVKSDYQHFEISNTDFYLLNKTKESMNVTEIKSQLESLPLTTCHADMYIRIYRSVYDDDIYSLKGYMMAKNSHRNGNYTLSQFSFDELPIVITEALKRAKRICE
ncbi:putative transcriptional regulator [Aliivibrio wodanis]|uniref:Putative transcriptional regulator n=1 Tax=Aliivibrio wodanis TaxID=80852 RepID=A0A090IPD2_9GAMM|nr:putative transcriptional regulator [Aliivibrio wodanis]